MIVYGTKITADIAFPLALPDRGQTRDELHLSSGVPEALFRRITCGFPFFWSHGRMVYLYSDRLFDGTESGQPWCYEVKEVVRFYWVGGEKTIYYALDEKGDAALRALPCRRLIRRLANVTAFGALNVGRCAQTFTWS